MPAPRDLDGEAGAVYVGFTEWNELQDELRMLRKRVRELATENERLRCDLGLGHIIAQQLRDLCGGAAEQCCRN